MSRSPSPDFDIAALRKKRTDVFDPMAAGPGTTWEDRGTHGTLAAFLKTCFGSMTNVGTITRQIRRPETTADARPLVIGCCVCWAVSAGIHGGYYFWRLSRHLDAFNVPDAVVNPVNLAIELTLFVAAGGLAAFGLFLTFNLIFAKLIAQEKDAPLFPAPLIYNVTAYAFGPSVLAVVPFVGPPLAFVLIGVNAVRVGMQRLRLRFAAAMIDTVLAMAALLGMVAAGFVVWYVLFVKVDPLDPVHIPDAPTGKQGGAFIPGL